MRLLIVTGVALLLLGSSPLLVKANLNPRQARKLISRMPGFELSSSAVRVKGIELRSRSSAEASVDIELAFRLGKNEHGSWDLGDIRTGPNQWEQIEIVLQAIKVGERNVECNPAGSFDRKRGVSEPSVKRAKCLIAGLLGVDGESETIRIKEITLLSLPLGRPAALVLAVVQADIRFVNDPPSGWKVTEMRLGRSEWTNLQQVIDKVDQMKSEKAKADLEMIAKALEKLHADRGFYVASDKQGVLMDFLSPAYLPRILRIDPWHRPYLYQGGPNQFKLRSAGPDGKEDTADDIVIDSSSQ